MTLKNAIAALCLKSKFLKLSCFVFWIIFLAIQLLPNEIKAQDNDERNMPLMLGSSLPDDFWNKDFLIYNDGDTTRRSLASYKGKLIILDFWWSKCAICLAWMKEKEAVASKFPRNVKLVYVNPLVTKDRFQNVLSIQDKLENSSLHGTFSSIIEDDYIHKLFPSGGYPRYVLISPRGNFIALSSMSNINEPNIRSILKDYKLKDE